jgi:hypothetical protein
MQTLEQAKSQTSEDLAVSPETGKKEVREQISYPEGLRPEEHRTLVAQCSILVMVASIVVWLIAA